jgi:RHS repeat-associated protein
MKYKLTFALVALMTTTAFAAFQAPLPEFKNEKQLAEWRAEKASEATKQGCVAEGAAFYTGKPYLALSGDYAFKYRSYSPELARWTSEDPSGFPDGANASFYAPVPTEEFDSAGLAAARSFSEQVLTITIGIYIYDTTNSFTNDLANRWKTLIESSWVYSGIDKSNNQSLSLNTQATVVFQSGGTMVNWEAQGYNLVTFSNHQNQSNTVTNFNSGSFRTDIQDRTFVHEVGHFMKGLDRYTVSTVNGLRTTTPEAGWSGTIMGGGDCTSAATKLDANYILERLGENTHLFE